MENVILTRDVARVFLHFEPKMEVCDEIRFQYYLHSIWMFTLKREDEKYAPARYVLEGDGDKYGTWVRRYSTIEQALLHVVNNLNENKNIQNRYATLGEWLNEKER